MQYFYCILVYPAIVEINEVVFIKKLDTYLYRADIRKKLIGQSNTKAKEASPVRWSQKRRINNVSQNPSIICPHSLDLMEFLYLRWFWKKTIQMQTGTPPILLTIR